MLRVNDAVSGAALACVGAAVLIKARSFPNIPMQSFGASLFPAAVGALLVVCGLALVISGVRRRTTAPALAWPQQLRTPASIAAFAAVIAGIAFVAAGAETLGFLIALPLALIAWLRVAGVPWPHALLTAVVTTALLQVAFYSVLRVPLPWGLLTPIAW